MKNWPWITIVAYVFSSFAFGQEQVAVPKSPEDDRAKIIEYNQSCQLINALIVRNQFKVDCFSNFQHFGPTSIGAKKNNGQIRIAGYNLLHPGTSKALFKDYNLVAKIMNQYDVVAGLELLDVVGHDRENNESVVSFLRESPKLQSNLKLDISNTRDAVKKKELMVKLDKLVRDTKMAYDLFRAPGYFKVLMALKKLDPSWSLILSPRGDSALEGSVEEMVGFFYRASDVLPAINQHCNENKDSNAGVAVACIANLTTKYLDKNYTQSFARRPFMASFKSGNFKFTLISNHVVFGFSGDEEASKRLMKNVFGVEQPSDLGMTGINSGNFARFAEVKITLEFMNQFKKRYRDDNIMFVSDTNLTASNAFWPEVLKSFPGGSLLGDAPSTISPTRYNSDNQETNGVANSYDHFILDKSTFSNCSNAEIYNYFHSPIMSNINSIYTIRGLQYNGLRLKKFDEINEDRGVLIGGDVPPEDDQIPTKFDYPMTPAGQSRMDSLVGNYNKYLDSLLTVKRNVVVSDDFSIKDRTEGFRRRIFLNQLTNTFYYRYVQEILSDHFPISISCKN
jgi:hypothetical protein